VLTSTIFLCWRYQTTYFRMQRAL